MAHQHTTPSFLSVASPVQHSHMSAEPNDIEQSSGSSPEACVTFALLGAQDPWG